MVVPQIDISQAKDQYLDASPLEREPLCLLSDRPRFATTTRANEGNVFLVSHHKLFLLGLRSAKTNGQIHLITFLVNLSVKFNVQSHRVLGFGLLIHSVDDGQQTCDKIGICLTICTLLH